jgi:hypothetical protein
MTWDHGMNLVLDEEVPMQIFNLALQEQQQRLFEGQYVINDNYSVNIIHIQSITYTQPNIPSQMSNYGYWILLQCV